ncbi:MAG: M23 family metallopeptidase [Candidatus Glassbacteria bacterium]|nr:M23 family metallopeptidase [Candidatus Glassbacteria bacterium]
MSRFFALASVVLFPACLPVFAADAELAVADSVLVQGQIVTVRVYGLPLDTVTGTFDGSELPFVRSAPDSFYTLLAVDMDKKPGDYKLAVRLSGYGGDDIAAITRTIPVRDAGFPVQRLTLPPAKVFPDSAATARINRESALRNRRWKDWSDRPFWGDRFIAPLEGELNRFGSRRIINGASRGPHSGADISAPAGTPVIAPAGGRVLLTGDFFFTGNSIYIDHGLGMIGMFFHLSEIDVAEGEMVEQGHVIGRVGATGRVTGPHLHWGIRWRDARINPGSLLELKID